MFKFSDSCHTYDLVKLNKKINNYQIIKVETNSLKNLIYQSSSEKNLINLKNLSKQIVIFNDLNPISNWFDFLKDYYSDIVSKTKTKYISCIFLKYTDLKDYIIRPKNKLIYSKKSKIQGKGIFIVKDIPKNTEIMRYIDTIKGNTFMYDDSYLINHSTKNDNVYLKYILSDGCNYSIVVSKRLIHKDEELLINYLSFQDNYPQLDGIEFEEK